MSKFTSAEIEYLQSQRVGRPATVGVQGDHHVVPVHYRHNHEQDTIDIGGLALTATKKYRDAVRHGRVALVVDDILPTWEAPLLEIRGTVQTEPKGGREIKADFLPAILRVTPTYFVSAGINEAFVGPREGKISFRGCHAG